MHTDIRAFFALTLPLELQKTITSTLAPLYNKGALAPSNWVKPEKLHITLAFLGNITQLQYQTLKEAVNPLITKVASFTLELVALQTLTLNAKTQLLYLQPLPLSPLTTLALSIKNSAAACGLSLDKRPFTPHMTLAHIKSSHKIDPTILHAISLPPLHFPVTAIKLIESKLHQETTTYSTLTTYNLAKEAR